MQHISVNSNGWLRSERLVDIWKQIPASTYSLKQIDTFGDENYGITLLHSAFCSNTVLDALLNTYIINSWQLLCKLNEAAKRLTVNVLIGSVLPSLCVPTNNKGYCFIRCEIGDRYSIEVTLWQGFHRDQNLGGSQRLHDYLLVSAHE